MQVVSYHFTLGAAILVIDPLTGENVKMSYSQNRVYFDGLDCSGIPFIHLLASGGETVWGTRYVGDKLYATKPGGQYLRGTSVETGSGKLRSFLSYDGTCQANGENTNFLSNIMADEMGSTYVEAREVVPPTFAGPLLLANP